MAGLGLYDRLPLAQTDHILAADWTGSRILHGNTDVIHGCEQPINRIVWALFLGNVAWTLAYDTLYAMVVDRDDDLLIGVKSTAIVFGRYDLFAIGRCH